MLPIAQLAKGCFSDAGGLEFKSQTGRVMGKLIPSFWVHERLAIKGIRLPEHELGLSIRTRRILQSQTTKDNDWESQDEKRGTSLRLGQRVEFPNFLILAQRRGHTPLYCTVKRQTKSPQAKNRWFEVLGRLPSDLGIPSGPKALLRVKNMLN